MNTVLKIYKHSLSPFLVRLFGGGCRHYPTCSEYFTQAVQKHGILYGSILGTRRFLGCNPFSKTSYFDPVPDKHV